MGIAYSGTDIVWTAFDGSTKELFVANFHAAALQANWGWSEIADGYEYLLTSPQAGMQPVRLKLWKEPTPYNANRVCFQMLSQDGARVASIYPIRCDGEYKLHANACQFFLARTGVTLGAGWDGIFGYYMGMWAICGGIPYVPTLAEGALPGGGEISWVDHAPQEPNEAWWCCQEFRWSWHCTGFDACWNGDHRHQIDKYTPYSFQYITPGRGFLHLPVVTPVLVYNHAKAVWWDDHEGDEPLYLDPLIAWGQNTATADNIIRGQLWDAVIVSVDRPLDHEMSFEDLDWVNYMHWEGYLPYSLSYYSSLYLLKGIPAGAMRGHYAY